MKLFFNGKKILKNLGMKVEIKGLKTFEGREGYGFTATLYVEGKKVYKVHDSSNGGCIDLLDTYNEELAQELSRRISKLPKRGKLVDNLDSVINYAVIVKQIQTQTNKRSKKGICVATKKNLIATSAYVVYGGTTLTRRNLTKVIPDFSLEERSDLVFWHNDNWVKTSDLLEMLGT